MAWYNATTKPTSTWAIQPTSLFATAPQTMQPAAKPTWSTSSTVGQSLFAGQPQQMTPSTAYGTTPTTGTKSTYSSEPMTSIFPGYQTSTPQQMTPSSATYSSVPGASVFSGYTTAPPQQMTQGGGYGSTSTGGSTYSSVPGASVFPGYQTAPPQQMTPNPNAFSPSSSQQGSSPTADTSQDGILNQPGYGEQYWQQHQNDFTKPTAMSSFLPAASGRLLGMDYQPTEAQSAYNTFSQQFGQPGQGTQNAWNTSRQLQAPTSGENTMQAAQSYFSQPNLTYGYAQDTSGAFQTPTMGEQNLAVTDQALSGLNYGQQGVGMAANALAGNNATQGYNASLEPWSQAPSAADRGLSVFAPQLVGPSASEQLYSSGQGENNLDTYYNRQEQLKDRDITNRMAAMGVFGSGATARALEETNADLGAQQARDMAALAQQSDQSQIARTNAANSFFQNADQSDIAQRSLGLQGSQASDEGTRQNVNTMLNAAQQASNEGLGKINARTNAATGGGEQALQRLLGGSTVANAGDQSLFAQGQGLGNLGGTEATAATNRLTASSQQGLAADIENLARGNANVNAAQVYDNLKQQAAQTGVSIEQLLGNLTQGMDSEDQRRIVDAMNAATGAQNLEQGRYQTGVSDALKGAEDQSGIVTGGTNAATDEQTKLLTDQINGIIAGGALSQQQSDQLTALITQLAGLALGAKK